MKYCSELTHDDGQWVVVLFDGKKELGSTYGRTIEQAKSRAFEALAVLLDCEEDELKIEFSVKLPDALLASVDQARAASEDAEEAQERASQAMREAAQKLAKQGLSARDVGELIGVSRQRAHLLMTGR